MPESTTEHDTILRYRSSVGGSRGGAVPEPARNLLTSFRRRLIITDALVIATIMLIGLLVSSRQSAWQMSPLFAVYGMPPIIGVLWLALLLIRGSYDQRIVGLGTEEIRRIISATLLTFAVVAGVSYLIRADISRAYAFISLPVGLILLIIGRFAWRAWLYRQRRSGQLMQPTIIIGAGNAADALESRLTRDAYAGYHVVGRFEPPDTTIPDWLANLDQVMTSTGATALALVPSEMLTSHAIRELAWHIEGRNLDLLMAPAILDVAGPRLTVRPAAGLPLLHLDEAVLTRPKAFTKRSLDLIGSITLSVLLLPVFAACAIAVRVTSRGPVLFRQTRIGAGGVPFTMIKFRTMVDGADELRDELRALTSSNDPPFKLREDPRLTSVGRFLRRWSLDELPQLWNVVGGSMSLVGPRPHPLDDVSRYELAAFRRLALKPGMTGLWQVEGRSELSWGDALQFDLYYVETWSLSGDIVILARTVRAVLVGRGAA